MDTNAGSLRARVREILQHYLANPHSADSLEGVAEWRLLDDFVQRRVEETRLALEWLVEQGLLTRSVSRAAPPVYRLNLDAIADARRLIDESESPRRDEL